MNENSVIEVDYVHVLSLREDKAVNINYKNPLLAGSPRILAPAFMAAGLPTLSSITDLASSGRSRYDGLNIFYRRRFSQHFSVNASYVLSRALAYHGAAASYSSAPSNVTNYLAPYDFGPTPSDERHRFVFSGTGCSSEGEQLVHGNVCLHDRVTAVLFGFGWLHRRRLRQRSRYTVLPARHALQQAFQNQRRACLLEFFFQAFDLTNRANFCGNYQNNIRSTAYAQPIGYITPSSVVIPQFFSGEAGFTFRF